MGSGRPPAILCPSPCCPTTLALCQAKFSCDLQGLPCSVGRGGGGKELKVSCRFPGKQIDTALKMTQDYFQSPTQQLAISDHMCGAVS